MKYQFMDSGICILTFGLAVGAMYSRTTADSIRVCTYNLLNFGGDDIDRVNPLRSILNEIDPQILVVQELRTVEGDFSGLRLIADSVAGQLDFPLVVYTQNSVCEDSYNAIYIDSTRLEFLAMDAIGGDPRSHLLVVVRVRATGVPSPFSEGTGRLDRRLRTRIIGVRMRPLLA